MRTIVSLVLLLLIASPIYAVGSVCGGAGLAGGSGSKTSTNGNAALTFTSSTASGALTIGTTGGSAYRTLSSQRGKVDFYVSGFVNTTCSDCGGYCQGSGLVRLYRVDTGATVGSTVVTYGTAQNNINFAFSGSEVLASNGIYEVQVATYTDGGVACTTSAYNVYWVTEQFVCI